MVTHTQVTDFAKLFPTNASGSSITALTATSTEPTGDGVMSPAVAGQATANNAHFVFYGTRSAADNETFTARITGWRKIGNGTLTLWVPVPLLALSLTQGTSVGASTASVSNTEYFADTIAVTTAFTSAYEVISPADNTVASVKVDFIGCEKIQVQLAKGDNATCNALGALF